jgi:hypothetical protein
MKAMDSDRLRALLWDLAADDRALLECRIVDGWRYADIAVHLGVPRGVLADNCQARSCALFAALTMGKLLDEAMSSESAFHGLISAPWVRRLSSG